MEYRFDSLMSGLIALHETLEPDDMYVYQVIRHMIVESTIPDSTEDVLFAIGNVGCEWTNIPAEIGYNGQSLTIRIEGRSEERRVGKECRSRWSPYH